MAIWRMRIACWTTKMTIWRMRIACWIHKATETHWDNVILIAFAFYLHVVTSFSCIPVICPKLVLFLTPLHHYCPTGRRNHGRPLKRLLDMWERNGSTSGQTPWQIYDDDDDCFCTTTKVTRTLLNVTFYLHCLSCLCFIYRTDLTLWRRNYFFLNFSTPCI